MRNQPPLETYAYSLAFHPSGLLATGTWNALYFWDPITNNVKLRCELAFDRTATSPLAFTPDGRWMVVDYHLVDLGALPLDQTGHTTETVSAEDNFRFLRREPVPAKNRISRLALSADGRILYSARGNRLERVLLPECWSSSFSMKWGTGHGGCISLATNGNGSHVAAVYQGEREVPCWDPFTDQGRWMDHDIPVHKVALAPEGQLLATADEQGGVHLWNPTTRKRLALLTRGHSVGVRIQALTFAPGGRLLAAGDDRGIVRIWSTATHHEIASLDWEMGPVRCLAFAADGMTIALASTTGKVFVWDVDE